MLTLATQPPANAAALPALAYDRAGRAVGAAAYIARQRAAGDLVEAELCLLRRPRSRPPEQWPRVLAVLAEGVATARGVARRLRMSDNLARQHLRTLARKGLAAPAAAPAPATQLPHRWAPTDAGRALLDGRPAP